MGGGSFIDDLFDSVFDPIKDAVKEVSSWGVKAVREAFKGLSKITGTSLFDKIGEGLYTLGMGIIEFDFKTMIYGAGMALGVILSPFTLGTSLALTFALLMYQAYTRGDMLAKAEEMMRYQITTYYSYNAFNIIEKGEWLAGGVCRSEVLAGGDMFNPTGIIDANGMAYGYNGVSDTTLLNSINNAYENLAGGSTYNAHLAGSHNWRPNKIVNKYFNSTSSTLL